MWNSVVYCCARPKAIQMSNVDPSKRNIRRPRFSLRELMLLVAVIGLALAVLFSRPHRQRRAVDAIRALGGTVACVIGQGDGVPTTIRQSPWSRWMMGEVATRVRSIDLSNTKVTDSDLTQLESLSDTRALNLAQTPIQGVGLAVLRSMPQLKELDLSGTKITDASLAHLRRLSNLEVLNLNNTPITGTGLAVLRTLPSIGQLSLRNTGITNASLAHLAGLKQLRTLDLDNTQVTDAGLVRLQECVNLQALSLENTRVGMAGVLPLRCLTRLEDLKAMGLDLRRDDLYDENTLEKKLRYTRRSHVVSDPRLLSAIVRAWSRRQRQVVSWDIKSVGVQTERNVSFAIQQECVVDCRGRLRLSHTTLTTRNTSFVEVFNGRTVFTLFGDSVRGYPVACEGPGTIDWSESVLFPIALAFRPLVGLFAEADLVVTSDVEPIAGHNCVVMYHRDGKLWIDASRDYVPLRYCFTRRGVTYGKCDIAFSHHDQAGWVPTAWSHCRFDRDGTVVMRAEVKVSQCSINEPIAADVFQLVYPPTTRVRDRVTGNRYIVSADGTRRPARPGE